VPLAGLYAKRDADGSGPMKWMRRSRSFDTAPLPYEKKWAIEIGCKLTPIMFAQTVS
jgi:hypothetical protein